MTDGAAQLTQTVARAQTFAQQRHSLGRSVLVGAGIGLTIGPLATVIHAAQPRLSVLATH